MDPNLIVVIAVVVVVLACAAVYFAVKPKKSATPEPKAAPKLETLPEAKTPVSIAQPIPKAGLGGKLVSLFKGATDKAGDWSSLEEALLEGDVGTSTTSLLLERVQNRKTDEKDFKQAVVEESTQLFEGLKNGVLSLEGLPKPWILSVVGINGAGKTTTIGKLAHYFKGQGKTVILGAGDTFRAGAIAQLKTWADRAQVEFVTGREGADPGAVAFDTVTAAKSRGADIAILDTAGRLHTKSNLMDELKKIHRVVKKVIPEAPHAVWLVIDGTLGQNSLQQAKEFQKALDVTGVVVTKLDGTAKGGALLAIASDLKLPVVFIGVGETAEDLVPFEPKPFVEAIFS